MSFRRRNAGVSALTLIFVLVFFGLVVTAGFYRWKARDVIAQRRAEIAAAPREKEPRLERWTELNRMNVYLRLQQLRVSAGQPWLVTHEVLEGDTAGASVLWGVDLSELAPEWTQREDLRVVVDLPAARQLGPGPVPPDKALFVPRLLPGGGTIDAVTSAVRAQYVAEHALKALIEALPQDLPGTALVVRVGGERRDTSAFHAAGGKR